METEFGNALKLQDKNVICVHINKRGRNKLSTTLDLINLFKNSSVYFN